MLQRLNDLSWIIAFLPFWRLPIWGLAKSAFLHIQTVLLIWSRLTLLVLAMETGVLCVVKSQDLASQVGIALRHKHTMEYPGTGPVPAASCPLSKGCCVSNPYHLALEKGDPSLCKEQPWKRGTTSEFFWKGHSQNSIFNYHWDSQNRLPDNYH